MSRRLRLSVRPAERKRRGQAPPNALATTSDGGRSALARLNSARIPPALATRPTSGCRIDAIRRTRVQRANRPLRASANYRRKTRVFFERFGVRPANLYRAVVSPGDGQSSSAPSSTTEPARTGSLTATALSHEGFVAPTLSCRAVGQGRSELALDSATGLWPFKFKPPQRESILASR